MLAALPAQPASGLQGLDRVDSRSKQVGTKQKPEQQDNPDLPTLAPSRLPSKHHLETLPHTNLLVAVASDSEAEATTVVPLASVFCRYQRVAR